MTHTPTVHHYSSTEYTSRAHGDEFIVVIDSLGRHWNPLKHPRDENGRFIRTFSFVTFELPGGGTASGRVSGIDRDGNLLVKVQGTTPGADPRVTTGGYVKVPHDKVAVRTVKAQLSGRGAAGRLNNQENRSVTTGVENLRRLGMDDQADKLAEAQKLANETPNPRDPASVERKQRAIDMMREVGEALGDERGKGFGDGDNFDDVKAELSPDERARLQTLDSVMGTTFTARHSLGDKTIDAENDEGPIKAKASEVRIQAAESELAKDFTEDAPVWDITSGSITEGHLEQPVKAEVRDTVQERQGQDALPELQRSTYQRLKSGLSRLSGYKQAAQVAPGDRFHADKNDDEVVVGSIVGVDATKSRAEFTGMVTRIYTDKGGKKHVYVRDFDPSGDKGYSKNYKDHSVQGGSIELATDDQQSTLFQSLALQGSDAASKSLVKSFTEEYLAAMERRYASPDAKRISPTGGFFDVAPVHSRTRKDANGEMLRIGDSVSGPFGEQGVVTYIEPNENTVKVQYPNGQKAARLTSTKLTRLHGPASDVYPGDGGAGDNNYVPTRDEAAADAEAMGADSVAKVIRDGGDARSIQAAMTTDVAFQGELDSVDALYDKRDQTLASGKELGPEDRTKLDTWDRLAAASAGQFREPNDPPPEPPSAPEPGAKGEAPTNPANPEEKVTEGGATVREEGGNTIVNDNTEDPIPTEDQQGVDTAIADAETGQEPQPEEAPAPQALAHKLVSDVGRLVEEAKQAPLVNSTQRGQLDKWQSELATAVEAGDGQGVVDALRGMTRATNSNVNANLRKTRLAAVLNGRATDGVPMADFIQSKLDAGEDIFNASQPVSRPDRPAEPANDVPEGVDPKVDTVDNAVSEALLMDDGSTLVMQGDQQIDDGFYVVDPATVTEYDNQPTTEDVAQFLNETQGSSYDGISVWFDENDGRFRMARVGVFDNEQDASDAAANSGTNQYVNISDGAVMNVALGGDPNAPTEAVEDPRSEERRVRTAGSGKATARSTAKQKKMLDHVAETSGDGEVGRIAEAVKNGEEISGADASRLADVIDGMEASQFEKPSDKGVASQMAHRLARAAGEEGARGYSSQNTALRRTSDVGISLSAQSQSDEVRNLVDAARAAVKKGDFDVGAVRFRQAAQAWEDAGLPTDAAPVRRAREHADRLDAMGGVTGPAPEQVPGEAPGQTPETPPAPEPDAPVQPPEPPPAPEPDASAQTPEMADALSALGSVDTAIEAERTAEDDNGPVGMTSQLEDASSMLTLIRGKITAEGPYSQLPHDLRELADFMDGNWRGTDPSPITDELRAAADGLDGTAPSTPEGPAPGGEGGGGAPFRLDDPQAVADAFLDDQRSGELDATASRLLAESLTGAKKLLGETEEGSAAHQEVNNAKFEAIRRINAAGRIRLELLDKVDNGTLTAQDVATELDRYGDDAQTVLDVWNGSTGSSLSAKDPADFMKQRIDAKVAATREEANGASREDTPVDLRWIRSQMETGSSESANRRANGRVNSLGEYQQLVTETASLLSTAQALRDPAVRARLRPDQVRDIPTFVQNLEGDVGQARAFLAEMKEQGVDTTGLDGVLREQLDKFDMADLLDAPPEWSTETMVSANRAGKAYRDARDAGKPGATEAAQYLTGMRDLLHQSSTPFMHRTLSGPLTKLVSDQIASNGGRVPDELRTVLQDPEFQRFGAFSELLGRLDIEDLINSPDVDLAEATGGRYTTVDWVSEPQVSPDLVSDDRPDEGSVEANMAWDEAMSQVTPNAASALNSMFTSMGGGIHRVPENITQANTPEAQRWKDNGWKRAGSDVRSPDQVEGAYSKDSNLIVVSDGRMVADTGTGSSVVVHELGHAMDSMLGETMSEGTWFTDQDPEFATFHQALKKQAQYGNDPEQSLLYWYFRNADEGATKHNGAAAKKEIFAQGYAAYAAGLQRLAQLPEGSGPISNETAFVLIGRELTMDRGKLVEWAGGLTFEQIREREGAIGHAIFDYFDDLENNRLPKIMTEPRAIPVRSAWRSAVLGLDQGTAPAPPVQQRATAVQKTKADTHLSKQHGLIQMQTVERGSPQWDAMETAVKKVSPGATMPPPTALYVTWNPAFATQGNTVIWKAVMPGEPKYVVEYTDQHKATQLAAKFQRQQRVNTALDDVHSKAQAEARFDETAALVLAMIETGMRVGSSERAGSIDKATGKKVPTFGGATMQAKHVFFPSETLMRFKFPGKAGKTNVYESRNPELRAAVQQLLVGKKPSDQVFAGTNSGRSIDYLRSATGIDDIINHDTRTRYATNMARDLVAKWPKSRLPKNEATLKKAKTEVAKKVGEAINDTWTVARDSYISNAVWERFEDSAGVPHSFDDSPPYGLVEGQVVQSIDGPPTGGPAPEGEAPPPAPVAASAEPADTDPEDSEMGYSLDHSDEGKDERQTWYDSFAWPAPPIVAGPDTTFSAEDGDLEPASVQQPAQQPAQAGESEEAKE